MNLAIRLNILKEAGQIDDSIYKGVMDVIEMFKINHGIELTEENGAMLITHLTVAIKRINENKLVETMDEELYKEISSDCNFQQAEKVYSDIEQSLNMKIPYCEKTFIMMHLCTLLNNI